MALELNIDLGPQKTGSTINSFLISSLGELVASITLTESLTIEGFYYGNAPTSLEKGVYYVRFLEGSLLVGVGLLLWDGEKEINQIQPKIQ